MIDPIFVGKGDVPVYLLPGRANRHGLIAGATGTGKTVTLQMLAESFSRMGVPVFMADVKGDLSGVSQPGGGNARVDARLDELGVAKEFSGNPVVFWDLYGEQGHPIRTTVSEMGPLLLARMLELNETQEGVLNIAFRLADDEGLLLLDYKDLRAILNEVGNRSKELQQTYGNVSTASIGTIQRQLLVLEGQGGEKFFGEPALDLKDFMRTEYSGRGFINILAANKLMNSPKLYATFLLWMLAELFEELPEVGDPEKPKLVFFFDEAHLLFSDAPKALLEKVEQVVRLIRSKGVSVFFVTQNPADIPDTVLAQLGNRVQHALRAFTPTEQKAIRAASNSFRANPNFKTEEAITQLGVGWGLVSMLDDKGSPCVVERTAVRPPFSRLGPATPAEVETIRNGSPVSGKYDQIADRESAFEVLKVKTDAAMQAHEEEQARIAAEKQAKAEAKAKPAARRGDSLVDAALKSTLRTMGSTVGRQIVRGILGNMFKR